MSSQLWVPGPTPPVEEFVARLLRQIAGVSDHPHVEVELFDGSRFVVESIKAEPGLGFITLCPHPADERPDALVVPLGSLRRIEISAATAPEAPFGFSLPPVG
ncbi:MAG: hypothetical protein ICV67_05865 [Thermoleophilia bacterium]|nr:hypothetical protein [Thermoleophilia bacterium]